MDARAKVDREQLVSWEWTRLQSLATERELPRLQRLSDGDVLIVGGGSELLSTASDTTEIFSARDRAWRAGPPLCQPHRDAEVIGLPGGDVLVIGGSDGPTKTGTTSVERLGRDEERFQEAAPMGTPRISHAACLLADGRVLVTGGQRDPATFLEDCEIYDPVSDTWTAGAPMMEARATHHLRALPDGRALAFGGGTDVEATHSAEFFDPASLGWTPTDCMYNARWGFASAVLDEGRTILVAGGRVPAQKGATLPEDQMVVLDGTERFDVEAQQWTRSGPLLTPRSMGIPNVELLELDDGGLLFPGGRTYPFPYHGTPSTEVYDRRSGSWEMLAPMRVGASYHAFIGMDDGTVLTAGGRGSRFRPLDKAETFAPAG
jgi:large repetitive protein